MNNNLNFFNSGDYKYISSFIETKLPILKEYSDFNNKYERLSSIMEELEKNLPNEQKELYNELITLFYKTEEYYFALSYSLGVKYGKDLSNI